MALNDQPQTSGYQQPPSWPMANTHPFPPQQGPVSESVGLAGAGWGGGVSLGTDVVGRGSLGPLLSWW